MLIIGLIEKDVLSVISLSCVLLKLSLRVDAVLLAETLPEFISD
jgi:hypothetical protein